MEYARTKGILAHRDIKPDNLMVDNTYALKVTDFGLAKLTQSIPSSKRRRGWFFRKQDNAEVISRTLTGSFMGTLAYMSPEQCTDSAHVDHRSDIYSFGIVLYQMASVQRQLFLPLSDNYFYRRFPLSFEG
jgi:eukaryotic-like serine/threonine-protein kinase